VAGADDAYRIRIGDCSVASVIADKVLIVYIIRVGQRKEVYRGM
jgi:mRNA-degrading endonuclease RelE of RelBE toxin-antitoxin system